MHTYKKNIVFFTGCLLMTVLLFTGCGQDHSLTFSTESGEATSQEEPEQGTQSEEDGTSWSEDTGSLTDASAADTADEMQEAAAQNNPSVIYIQVNGAVKYPGVYQLPAGARVFEAVELAGGMTEDAAGEAVNQALTLTDGEMITIYTQSEWTQMQSMSAAETSPGEQTAQADDGKININTADLDTLCTIPGIGQTRAESILAYRKEQGSFGSIEEIMNVSGIKDGLFQKIKDKIKV